ncbi:hypothetical protein D3C81_1077190 [compost metagenome]
MFRRRAPEQERRGSHRLLVPVPFVQSGQKPMLRPPQEPSVLHQGIVGMINAKIYDPRQIFTRQHEIAIQIIDGINNLRHVRIFPPKPGDQLTIGRRANRQQVVAFLAVINVDCGLLDRFVNGRHVIFVKAAHNHSHCDAAEDQAGHQQNQAVHDEDFPSEVHPPGKADYAVLQPYSHACCSFPLYQEWTFYFAAAYTNSEK